MSAFNSGLIWFYDQKCSPDTVKGQTLSACFGSSAPSSDHGTLTCVEVSESPLVGSCSLALSEDSLDTEAHWKCISGLPKFLQCYKDRNLEKLFHSYK